MEMESPRPLQTHPIRGPHGGWQKQEIDALHQRIEEASRCGESLRSVFESLGRQLGRKPNSIRNFYYAQVRQEDTPGRTLPFETFTQEEVEQLLRSVLTARARGMSVRACVRELAGGDHTKMLRYQNKYRSTVRTRPELVQDVMRRLSEEGVPFVSPYPQQTQDIPSCAMRPQAEQSGDPHVASLFASLDHLLRLAYAPHALPEQESEAQRRADRLSARCDMLRIALDDEQTRRADLEREAEGMVTLIKEYIALPDQDRLSGCGAFCAQAAQRLSAMECAMTFPQNG